ncbi:uncharacterized protein LOC135201779 [Macrobrachium nipponense]|uniref:uncharacterized protein LOC135201779 n=1 Tax=Macrobrachium nipponense TaxID=159736 RepID=UPI0030C8117F
MDECNLNRKSSRWYFMTELGITEYDLTAENALQEESHEVNSTIKSESSLPSYSPHSNETPKKAPTGSRIFGPQKNNASEQQKKKGLLDRITFLVSGGEVTPMINGVPQGYSPTGSTESISQGLHARKPATGGDGSHQSRDLVVLAENASLGRRRTIMQVSNRRRKSLQVLWIGSLSWPIVPSNQKAPRRVIPHTVMKLLRQPQQEHASLGCRRTMQVGNRRRKSLQVFWIGSLSW